MEKMCLKDFLSCPGDPEGKKEGLEAFDLKKTTMSFKETTEIGKYLEYRYSRGGDVDVCPLNQEIYQTLWVKTERSASALAFCKADEIITGDTMNSVQTTLNQVFIMLADKFKLTLLEGPWKWSFEECRKLYEADAKRVEDIVEEIDGTKDFLSAAYTIGNFIPCPVGCNKPRGGGFTKDYWDWALFCIYRWYQDHDDKYIKKIVGVDNNEAATTYMEWLKSFTDEKTKLPSWDIFIEANYLQDFTEWNTRPYGRPKEFWDRHFSGPVSPQTPEQIEAFFAHATEGIKARSKRMVEELKKK